MQTSQPSLLMRDDTFFGVCEGLGEDFGFNPVYLRVIFAALLLWNPVVTVAAYAVGGVIVLAGRLLFPKPRAAGALFAAERNDRPVEPEYSVAA